LLKAIKFIPCHADVEGAVDPAGHELGAIHQIKAIRHPFLLSMERIELCAGELIVVMELADGSLHDLFVRERAAHRPGIARERLLGYLREAAEALDLLNRGHQLLHRDVKPQNLFLVGDHVKVGDFGLVCRIAETDSAAGSPVPVSWPTSLTPLYAAPELFDGRVSPSTDQYSLALVYQQLLTGVLPFQGTNARQLLLQHVAGKPNLDALPAADRPLVARALAKDPADRFPSCAAFIEALTNGTTAAAAPGHDRPHEDGPPRILVAEDNAFHRTFLQSTLQQWGFAVEAVADGNAAWSALQQPGAPRLVILDWQMPGLDGLEVCRRLRARRGKELVYIILLTGRNGLENKLTGLREGADDYLTKPVTRAELKARLQVGGRIVGLPPARIAEQGA
jgi:CheY-like chemotaxis protein